MYKIESSNELIMPTQSTWISFFIIFSLILLFAYWGVNNAYA
jgi:hypothetical protein